MNYMYLRCTYICPEYICIYIYFISIKNIPVLIDLVCFYHALFPQRFLMQCKYDLSCISFLEFLK